MLERKALYLYNKFKLKNPYFHKIGVPWGEGFHVYLLAITKFENVLGNTLKKNILSLGYPRGDYFIERAANIYWLPKKQFDLIINQIKTVNYFVEEALKIDAKKIVEAFDEILEKYCENQEQLAISIQRLKQREDSVTSKIKNTLDCYHSLYEQGFKVLVSFPIIAKEILINSKELKNKSIIDYINDNPSYKTKKIKTSLVIGGYQTNILLKGYDDHVRNAIAHKHIYLPDPDKEEVILKDIDMRTKKEWEKKFTHSELIELAEELHRTTLALELALGIFNLNNDNFIRKYSKKQNTPPSPRKIRDFLYTAFYSMGFDIIDVKKDDQLFNIKIHAETRPLLTEALKSPSELIWSNSGKVFKIKLPPIDFSVNLRENILSAFCRSYEIFKWFKNVEIEITNKEKAKKALLECSNPDSFFEKLNKCKNKQEAERLVEEFKLYKEFN